MISPSAIIEISKTRLEESKILFANGYYEGSFYLAGYSVELALKAKVCRVLDIPNLYDETFLRQDSNKDLLRSHLTHKLNSLILLSGLRTKFDLAKSNNVQLLSNWSFLAEYWSEKCRYNCCGTVTKENCERLITSIEDTQNGILTWILVN